MKVVKMEGVNMANKTSVDEADQFIVEILLKTFQSTKVNILMVDQRSDNWGYLVKQIPTNMSYRDDINLWMELVERPCNSYSVCISNKGWEKWAH